MSSKQLSLFDHLEEIRTRLIVTLAYFVIVFFVSIIWVKDLYLFIVKDLPMKLTVLGPSDVIWAYFMISGVIAITLTLPLIFYQIWAFVKPGLYEREQKLVRIYIPAMFFLFLSGFAFGYFIILPIILKFLMSLSEGMFNEMYTIHKYFTFVFGITLPFACLFLLPLLIMFLTTLGIINPKLLSKYRKYAYFILIVVATVISPPDFISDFIVAVPLILIYEISIICSKFVFHKNKQEQ